MKAYLINPTTRKITEVEYTGVFTNIYEHIGADNFDVARFSEVGDVVYVDDEGLNKGPVYNFFAVKGYPQPLAGKGLVLGTNEEGESISPKIDLTWLKANVVWIERLFVNVWAVTPHGKKKPTLVKDIDTVIANWAS